MVKTEHSLSGYSYDVPEGAVALVPKVPRDRARLLVFDRKTGMTTDATFSDLPRFLPEGAVLVLNQTRVIPARVQVRKATGGKAELLYLRREGGRAVSVLSNRPLKLGSTVSASGRYRFKVVSRTGAQYRLEPLFPLSRFARLMERFGRTPLPPYLKSSPLTESQRRQKYQAVFAKAGESVAAPTASLHFTDRLLRKLQASGFEIERVRLDVSLGTFAPLTEAQLKAGKLHRERYAISPKAAERLNAAKRANRPVIAVGTTTLRALESAAQSGVVRSGAGETDLFIRPGYRLRFVSGLITNFHVPRSSLLMLVATLVGRRRLLALYRRALKAGYRVFSFGDGMLVR